MTAAGLIGGTLSALATSILDVMTALIQDASKAEDKNIGFISIITMMLTDSTGFSVAAKGLYLRIWHVALTTVVMKNSVPFVCRLVMQQTWLAGQAQQIG